MEILEFKNPSQIEQTERMQQFLLYRYGLVISLKEIQELYVQSIWDGFYDYWQPIDDIDANDPKKRSYMETFFKRLEEKIKSLEG